MRSMEFAKQFLVVHVYLEEKPNGEEAICTISARGANQRERRIYLEQATWPWHAS